MPGFCSGTEIHPFLSISGIFEDGYRFLMLLMLFSNLFDVDLRDDFFGSNTWDTQRDLHPSTDHCCCCFRWSCYTLNVQGYIQNFGEVMFKIPQLKETCHLIKVVFFFFRRFTWILCWKTPSKYLRWGFAAPVSKPRFLQPARTEEPDKIPGKGDCLERWTKNCCLFRCVPVYVLYIYLYLSTSICKTCYLESIL